MKSIRAVFRIRFFGNYLFFFIEMQVFSKDDNT